MAAGFRAVHLDFGTGDGAFVLRAAVAIPPGWSWVWTR
jgi:hypothetical protein